MVLKTNILNQEKDVLFQERISELLKLSQDKNVLDSIQNINRRLSTWEKIAKDLMEENKKIIKTDRVQELSMFTFLFTYHPKNKQKLRIELKPPFYNGLLSSSDGTKLTVSKLISSSNEIVLGVIPIGLPLSSENYPILTVSHWENLKNFIKMRMDDIFDELSEDYLIPKSSNNSKVILKKYIPYN